MTEAENEMREALEAGVKLLRTTYGSVGGFSNSAKEWLSQVEPLLARLNEASR